MSNHEGPIKTPKQLIIAIVLGFLIPIIAIILMVKNVSFSASNSAGESAEAAKASLQKRISPVANLNYKDANAPIVYKTGEEVYTGLCITCHGSGAAGAPKFGDIAAWSPRLAQGLNGLVHSLLNGKGAMQARAGSSPDDYSDYELTRAVVYLTNNSGGKFSEPAAPASNAGNMFASLPEASTTSSAPEKAIEKTAEKSQDAAILSTVAKEDAADKVAVGKKIYEEVCIACHGAGIAGAPKFGDKAAWSGRIGLGIDALYASALKGKGAMPAKGGYSGSDEELKYAVEYIVNNSK
jgi:cytochrome c5